jgi:hypothetical protein
VVVLSQVSESGLVWIPANLWRDREREGRERRERELGNYKVSGFVRQPRDDSPPLLPRTNSPPLDYATDDDYGYAASDN